MCHKIRNHGKDQYVYIILLSALDQNEALVAGMEAGADDYITKPFKFSELKVRLHAGMRIILLQKELIAGPRSTPGKSRPRSSHRSLQPLKNPPHFQQELHRAEREGNAVGVILADLDHFKTVNDTYVTLVLRTASGRGLASLRSYDAIGRYGCEEFVIVLPGSDVRCTAASAERLRIRIECHGHG